MKNLSTLEYIAMILIIVGGLNWLLIGLFSFDLVAAIFGVMTVVSKIVYILVGLSAVYTLFNLGKFSIK